MPDRLRNEGNIAIITNDSYSIHALDNADKHRLLHQAFAYPGVDRGVDLIEVLDGTKVKWTGNLWNTPKPLENGTSLARFIIRGKVSEVIGLRSDAVIGFASGELGAPRTTYTEMIARVHGITDRAVALIDRYRPVRPRVPQPPLR